MTDDQSNESNESNVSNVSKLVKFIGSSSSLLILVGLIVFLFVVVFGGKKKCYVDAHGYSTQCSNDEWCRVEDNEVEGTYETDVCMILPKIQTPEKPAKPR